MAEDEGERLANILYATEAAVELMAEGYEIKFTHNAFDWNDDLRAIQWEIELLRRAEGVVFANGKWSHGMYAIMHYAMRWNKPMYIYANGQLLGIESVGFAPTEGNDMAHDEIVDPGANGEATFGEITLPNGWTLHLAQDNEPA